LPRNDRIFGQIFWHLEGKIRTRHSLSNGNYLFWVATEAANRGEYKDALNYLEQVLATNPKHAMAWHVRGNCLDSLGQYQQAVQSYDSALTLDPGNAETWFNKGITLKKMGREKESKQYMDIAIKLALGE
jgi:tetratricopeptide (TPR) repeat protein